MSTFHVILFLFFAELVAAFQFSPNAKSRTIRLDITAGRNQDWTFVIFMAPLAIKVIAYRNGEAIYSMVYENMSTMNGILSLQTCCRC